jgi:predicted nucleotidyltransferase
VSEPASGFVRALAALTHAGVEFVVVGVGGINFYARTPAQSFATLDLGALLAPVPKNLRLALSVLAGLGYAFEAGGEPFVDLDDTVVLARVIANGATLNAIHREASQLDLMTSISGYRYSELVEDASRFEVAGAEVQVGRLTKLLHSKEVSGRRKDLEFLRIYRAALEDGED